MRYNLFRFQNRNRQKQSCYYSRFLDADTQIKIVTPFSPIILNLTCPEVDNNIQKEHGIGYTVECYPFLREIIVEERYGYW